MDESQAPGDGQAERSLRWFDRVVPVIGLVLLLVGLATLTVPGFRDELALSTTRQPEPFVELYFTRTVAHPMCSRDGDAAAVRFVVVSHLERSTRMAYRLTVRSADGDAAVRKRTVGLEPGQARQVSARVPTAAGDYTVTVLLPTLDQRIRAHCGRSRA